MQRNGIIILASVALAAVAIIVAAYIFTHKPEPEGPSAYDQSVERAHEERVACLEGGGTWDQFLGCQHSSVASAAPAVEAPSTSAGGGNGGGGNGGQTIEEFVTENIVDQMLPNLAQQAKFCVGVDQLGYFTALQAFKRGYGAQTPPAQKVFAEAFSRCV